MVDFCGQFTVHASTGQQVAIFCPYNNTEQYVQLQIMAANSNVLTPAEVLVWGVCVNKDQNYNAWK